MRGIALAGAIVALGCPAIATAQSAPEVEGNRVPDAGAESERIEGNLVPRGPAGSTENLLRGLDFNLEISEDSSKASAQIGGYRAKNLFGGDGSARQIAQSWSLKLDLPVGGGDDITASDTLDALGNGPKLTFSYSWLGFESAAQNLNSDAFDKIMEEARANCERDAEDAAARGKCTSEHLYNDPQFARLHVNPGKVNRALFSGMWRGGIEGSIGINRFDYLDAAPAEQHRTRPQFAAGLFAALYPGDAMSALIVKGEYQNGFEADDETIVCKPVIADPAKDCAKGVPTPPSPVEKINVSVSYQRIIDPKWKAGKLAVAPKFEYDALGGDWAAELPVYFLPAGDWPVSPEVAVSYSSKQDAFDFALRLRASFSFH